MFHILGLGMLLAGGILAACGNSTSSQHGEISSQDRQRPQSGAALTCRATNLVLVFEAVESNVAPLLQLHEDGQLEVLMSSYADQPSYRLDPRGCLVQEVNGKIEVVVEMIKEGRSLWTPNGGLTPIDEGWMRTRSGLSMRIDSNGDVIHSGNDTSGVDALGQFHFEGMDENGLCGAQVMLEFFGSIFGGLRGGGDGTVHDYPPPVPSVCPELHRSSPHGDQ